MKRAVNLSLDAELLDKAKNLDINLSQTLEKILCEQVRLAESKKWLDENKKAFQSYEAHIENRSSFSDKLRSF